MSNSKKTVVCVGMMSCDSYYWRVDDDVLQKQNSACDKVEMAAGGDATNVSIDMARLGFSSRLIGMIGNDFHGDGLVKTPKSAGVDTSRVIRRDDVESTMTMIMYLKGAASANERHCIRNEGGNARISESDITDDMLSGADHLHYGSFGPLKSLDGEGLERLLKRAKDMGMTVSLDVKGVGRDFKKLAPALKYVDYFMPNLEELSDLTGLTDLSDIKREMKRLGVGILAIKMAEKGVFVTDFNEEFTLPTLASSDEIVDLMGAGDAFCAGFVAASLYGLPLRERAVIGSLASKRCLAASGASSWQATYDELKSEAESLAL